jgi:hypothetical protein
LNNGFSPELPSAHPSVALTDEQIERYSRQIIVPRVGGTGQERLLSARLVIAGDLADIETVLAYMVAAGVGRIDLIIAGAPPLAPDSLIARMREHNRDAAVAVAAATVAPADTGLILAIAGSAAAVDMGRMLCAGVRTTAATIFARLDNPAKIAIMPSPPPCVVCADADLTQPFSRRCDTADSIAMMAAAEAFKLLAGYAPASPASLIEFHGYEAAAVELRLSANLPRCSCSSDEPRSPR